MELIVDNPFSLEEAVRRPLADPPAADRILAAAHKAAAGWAEVPLPDRIALCLSAIDRMEASAEAIAADITRMMGKPLRQARNEVRGMAGRARHMCAIAEESLADTLLPAAPGVDRRILRCPLGVVFNLPAWNYPLLICVNVVVPAVLAGNAVVIKHSHRTPLCGEHFADAFAASGAPSGLVQALHCTHETAARIVADPRVGYVAFTGSVDGGRKVYAATAAHRFIDVGLELGGKDGAYVAEDADLQKAVEGIVDGACYNAGQSCCAVERAYVHRRLYDRFVEASLELVKAYKLGDPASEEVTLGPMAQPNAPAFLKAQIDQALDRGARVLWGGKPATAGGRGRFFEPTLIVGVDHSMDVMRHESFGPILPVVPVDSDEEAIRLINDSDLGLTASVWTADAGRAGRIARRLEVGTVYMNQCDTLDPALPWTGVKDSGKGSTLSKLGFSHLTRPKALNFRVA